MTGVSVSCGCGRTMTLDGARGRNAFRCGCGARVIVSVATQTIKRACVGRTGTGEACRLVPTADSQRVGTPLCADHLEAFLDYLSVIEEGQRWAELMKDAWEDSRVSLQKQLASHSPWQENYEAARRKAYRQQAVVYYIRFGNLIKIGTTTNMRMRMGALMPDEVLATEPGGEELEKQRHRQFAHLKARGERFRASPDLLDHIAAIKADHGEPNMTGHLYVEGEAIRPVRPT